MAVQKKKNKKERKQKRQKIYIMSRGEFCGLLGILLVIYIGASIYFSSHFFFGTKINGMKCQGKTVEQAKEMMVDYVDQYQLTLQERENRKDTISSEQIGLRFVDDGEIDQCKKEQKGYLWISFIWKDNTYSNTSFAYDKKELEGTVEQLTCFKKENITAPKMAYPKYNEEKKAFEIVKEMDGTTVNQEILLEKVSSAIEAGHTTLNLEKAGCYENPKWYQDDEEIISAKDLMNKYLKSVITYDMDYTKEVVDRERTHEWIEMNDDCEVSVNRQKVRDFMTWMGKTYNTVGKERQFTTPSGSSITVSGGTYGWRLNQEDETDELIKLIKKGEETTRTPLYLENGLPRDKDGNDLHDTYIAISILNQTMWYYKNGECVLSTDVVTGNTSLDRGTPTGVYAIAYKQKGHTLTGEGYATKVDYWMPFYEWRGIGIHDASWRDSFGGNIYKTEGSHGCVNTPYYAVKRLFEIVEDGTPVVVY